MTVFKSLNGCLSPISWLLKLGFFSALLWSNSVAADARYPQVEVVTSHFKPYSYIENDKPVGFSVSQVEKVFDELGYDPVIRVAKWKDAYNQALDRPNVLIFSMLRTPEREDKFHWIGKIGEVEAFLFKKKGNVNVEVSTLSDGLKYVTGAIEKDAKGKYLIDKGYKPYLLTKQHLGIKMLMHGRLDLIVGDIKSIQHDLKESGLPGDSLTPVFKLTDVSKPIYLAFSKGTPPELVEAFRAAYKNAFDKE